MNISNKFVVVGSGPSSFACCAALVAAGIRPLVLDIGSTESQNFSKINRLDERKVPKRRSNNFMYSSFKSSLKHTFLLESIGFGGFSSVWGGVIKKPTDKDLENWPICLSDLEPYFNEIDKFFIKKELLNLDLQGWGTAEKNNLDDSRLFRTSIDSPKIVYSKKNPNNIFSVDEIFQEWISDGLIDYRSPVRITRIENQGECVSLITEGGDIYLAERVYLASGAPQSALIMQDSLKIQNEIINLLENKLIISFWISLLRRAGSFGVPGSCFSSSDGSYYMQIYEFKEKYLREVFTFHPVVNLLAAKIAAFITFSFVYINQNNSGKFNLIGFGRESSFKEIPPPKLILSLHEIKTILKKSILSKAYYLGSRVKNFGFGYHVGGSFPMKKNPKTLETNILGNFKEFPRLHLVDGSVLTTLPAMPLTYLIMANSMRITKLSLKSNI